MTYEEWHADWERRQAEITARREKNAAELKLIIGQNGENITDEIRKKWFINYGCCNWWSEEWSDQFALGSLVHYLDSKNHPELHKPIACWDNKPIRGYHHNKCSCGFEHSHDSSD